MRRLRIVVIVRCPLCGGWIVGNAYSDHLEAVHLPGPRRGFSEDGSGPGAENPHLKVMGSEALAYGVEGAANRFHEAGGDLTPGEAGQLLDELGRRWAQGQEASLGFLVYE